VQAAAGHFKLADYFAVIGLDEELQPFENSAKAKQEGMYSLCARLTLLAHLTPCVDMMIERVELFLVTKPADVDFIRQ
jgi:hypothetical protein